MYFYLGVVVMVKNILPKSPVAAAGLGLLLGAGIGGVKGWLSVKRGETTQKEAVAGAIKQGIMFGGVAAVSTMASGGKGGGAGLATMAVMGLSGGSDALPSMLMGLSGGGRGGGGGMGKGGGRGGQRQQGGIKGGSNQSSESVLDSLSNAVADMLFPQKTKTLAAEQGALNEGSVKSEVAEPVVAVENVDEGTSRTVSLPPDVQ